MMKVLIADDEKKVCLLLRNLISWEESNANIIGEAYTGPDAFELARKEHPDIIISDIRMPGYDGLELIHKVKEIAPDITFIMISGHKQFEYAQRAMRHGVKHYLLKPIDGEELEECLKQIRWEKQMEAERIAVVAELSEENESRDEWKRRFLSSIMAEERFWQKEGAIGKLPFEQIKLEEGNFRAIIVKLDSVGTKDQEIQPMLEKVFDILEKSIKGECLEYVSSFIHSGVVAITNFKYDTKEELKRVIDNLHEELEDYIHRFAGVRVTIGVGSGEQGFQNLTECIRTSLAAVRYRISFHGMPVIFYEDHDFEEISAERIISPVVRQRILTAVDNLDMSAVEQELRAVFELMKGSRNYSPVIFYKVSELCKLYLEEHMEELGYEKEMEQPYYKIWNEEIDAATNENAIQQATWSLTKRIIHRMKEEKTSRDIKPVRLIKHYIEMNYKEDISLNQLSELVHLNPSYVSSIFKKNTGMTFSEYLIICRMEEAKKLLVQTDKSITEIAEELKYQNSKSFSKMFMKSVGLKPSEYRKIYS